MEYKKEKYLKILKIELLNLIDDISGLIKFEKERHDNKEHTHFVYLENLVVLKDEIMGINGIIGKIERISDTLSENNFREELEIKIKDFIIKRGYPLVVYDLIHGKMQKIEEINDIK